MQKKPLIAGDNSIVDLASLTLQHRLQLQDVLSPA